MTYFFDKETNHVIVIGENNEVERILTPLDLPLLLEKGKVSMGKPTSPNGRDKRNEWGDDDDEPEYRKLGSRVRLSDEERDLIVQDILGHEMTAREIAEKQGVSIAYVHVMKSKLRQKGRM